MAKALLGHVGFTPDARNVAELHRLRSQLARLAAENQLLRECNEALRDELTLTRDLAEAGLHEGILSLSGDRALNVDEPALT